MGRFKLGQVFITPGAREAIHGACEEVLKVLGRHAACLKNAAFVNIIGLTIEGGMGHGIDVISGHDLRIAGCTVHNVGGSAIRLERTSRTVVQSNDVVDDGGWGIELRSLGDRPRLTHADVRIVNNHVYRIGVLAYKEAVIMDQCVGVTLAHNLLHDLPKGGVRTDLCNDCTLGYNEVHNNALKESDTGAFYNYGGWSSYGNVFRFNFIHHANRSNGFYCDDGDSGDLFYNNVVFDTQKAILFGGGHDNVARNNLFIATKGQSIDDRGVTRNYRLGTKYETSLRELKPMDEPWKLYGLKLQGLLGTNTRLWQDVLDPAWKPELPNGSKLTDNVGVIAGNFTGPAKGNVTVSGNVSLPSLAEAKFFDFKMMDLRSKHRAILKLMPELNREFPTIGLRTDEIRLDVPSRQSTGGLSDRGSEGDAWNEDPVK